MSTKDITDLQVCEAYKRCEHGRPRVWPYEILQETTGQAFKVCYRAMERAHERGLLNYGTSLRTAWLTDKGKALLAGEDISTGFDRFGDILANCIP